jgi:hypothetical protein
MPGLVPGIRVLLAEEAEDVDDGNAIGMGSDE